MELRKEFRLTFSTQLGRGFAIRIPRANPNVTDADVISAMDKMISTGILRSVDGRPVSRESARLVKTTATEFEINV